MRRATERPPAARCPAARSRRRRSSTTARPRYGLRSSVAAQRTQAEADRQLRCRNINGPGCPNRWVLQEGREGQVTGWQTHNAEKVSNAGRHRLGVSERADQLAGGLSSRSTKSASGKRSISRTASSIRSDPDARWRNGPRSFKAAAGRCSRRSPIHFRRPTATPSRER